MKAALMKDAGMNFGLRLGLLPQTLVFGDGKVAAEAAPAGIALIFLP